MGKVVFLERSQISATLWDDFVAQTPQKIIYSYSWYLDIVAPRWGAFVVAHDNDSSQWEAVLPVTFKKKWNFWVVHQPLFCQFLTIIGNPDYTAILLNAFFEKFRFVSSFYLRSDCPHSLLPRLETFDSFTNYTKPLTHTYQQTFSNDRQNNLKKAQKFDWKISESLDIEPIIYLFKQNVSEKIEGGVAKNAYQILIDIFNNAHSKQKCTLLYASKNGKIEAGAMFLIDGGRVIYIFNAASVLGRQHNARTLMIDFMMNRYKNQDYIFDFESPDITNIATHYKSFGVVEEQYFMIRYNRLPLFLRQLHKIRLLLHEFLKKKY